VIRRYLLGRRKATPRAEKRGVDKGHHQELPNCGIAEWSKFEKSQWPGKANHKGHEGSRSAACEGGGRRRQEAVGRKSKTDFR
jgi:hypothetical protein